MENIAGYLFIGFMAVCIVVFAWNMFKLGQPKK